MGLTRSALRAATFTLAAICSVRAGRAAEAHPNGVVGTTFPADFPTIIDASLGVPLIGFGDSDGRVEHVLGILNAPWTWSASLGVLRSLEEDDDCEGADCD
jgi:hypothetical protein